MQSAPKPPAPRTNGSMASSANKLRNNMISMIGMEGETALTSAAAIANDADEPETHRIARRRGCLPPSVILRD